MIRINGKLVDANVDLTITLDGSFILQLTDHTNGQLMLDLHVPSFLLDESLRQALAAMAIHYRLHARELGESHHPS